MSRTSLILIAASFIFFSLFAVATPALAQTGESNNKQESIEAKKGAAGPAENEKTKEEDTLNIINLLRLRNKDTASTTTRSASSTATTTATTTATSTPPVSAGTTKPTPPPVTPPIENSTADTEDLLLTDSPEAGMTETEAEAAQIASFLSTAQPYSPSYNYTLDRLSPQTTGILFLVASILAISGTLLVAGAAESIAAFFSKTAMDYDKPQRTIDILPR